MKTQESLQCLLVLFGALTVGGCAVSTADEVGVAEEAALTSNALTSNALTSNALTSNALTSNALTSNALTSNALTSNALTSNALTSNALQDPNAAEVLYYIVSCALTPEQSVTVGGQTYYGELGIAPQWGETGGSCDTTCMGPVSACVLARVDYLGQHVEISVRSDSPALSASSAEMAAYPQIEATYYGNIFARATRRFVCLPPGLTQDPRVCGPSIESCVMQFTGACADACSPPLSAAEGGQGAYLDCAAPVRGDLSWDPANLEVFPGAVTVFLPANVDDEWHPWVHDGAVE
jgi:hypothetical protein